VVVKSYSGHLHTGCKAIVIKVGMTLTPAFVKNTESPYQMIRERHKWKISIRLNIKAGKDSALTRSSFEVSVMEMEQKVSLFVTANTVNFANDRRGSG
jgi:hypothetical protein